MVRGGRRRVLPRSARLVGRALRGRGVVPRAVQGGRRRRLARAPAALPAREPLPEPRRADPEGPAGEKLEGASEAAREGGELGRSRDVRLRPRDVRVAQRLRALRGGVQTGREKGNPSGLHREGSGASVHRETRGQGAGPRDFPVPQTLATGAVARRKRGAAARSRHAASVREPRGTRNSRFSSCERRRLVPRDGRAVRRAAVRRATSVDRREEVRPAPVRARHLRRPDARLSAPRGLRAFQHAQVPSTAFFRERVV